MKKVILSIERLGEFEFEEHTAGGVKIRHAISTDAQEIADLYKSSFQEHILVQRGILSNPKELEKQIALENKYWLVAEKEGKIKGCAAIEVADWNKSAEIERVVVDNEYRGNGVGSEICKSLVECAEKVGVEYLFAHCRGPEFGMQRALEKQGFRVSGIMPVFHVVHDGRKIRENFVYMERFLNGAEKDVESPDNLIPAAQRVKDAIEGCGANEKM